MLFDELIAQKDNQHTDNLSIDIDDYNTIKYRYEKYDRGYLEYLLDSSIPLGKRFLGLPKVIDFHQKRDRFYADMCLEFKEIGILYDLLEDSASKALLLKLCAFRIFGHKRVKLPLNDSNFDPKYSSADEYLVKENEISVDFMDAQLHRFAIHDHEVFATKPGFVCAYLQKQYEYHAGDIHIKAEPGDYAIDAGMCWGETSVYFANEVGETGKVFGFEFVPSNLAVTRQNVAANARLKDVVTIVEHPLWSTSGNKLFYVDWGPGSRVTADEARYEYDGVCETLSIDDLVQRDKIAHIDFIKMDIEGAELPSLKGAQKTIEAHKPKLAISLYHSIEEFHTIPDFLQSLNLGYKFYLGHHTIYQNETVLYAIAE